MKNCGPVLCLHGLVLVFVASASLSWAAENLVRNASFEDGAEHWQLPEGYQVVSDQSASGEGSLYCRRTDPQVYRLASQDVPFEPGGVYSFRCKVRTRGIVGEGGDVSATICVEWSGEDGWIGGAYVEGLRGDTDWMELQGRTSAVPPQATRMHVTVYLRRRTTGEAWFDDVVVEPYRPPAFRARIIYPPYRGTFLPGYGDRGTFAVELAPWVKESADEFVLELVQPNGPRGPVSVAEELSRTRAGPLTFVFPRPEADGPYSIDIVLQRGGELVQRATLEGRVAPVVPKVHADEQGRLAVGGEPFFPLGLYAGAIDVADIELLRGSPFNCLMPYGSSGADPERMRPYLDAAHGAGVRILYSLKDHYPGTRYFKERVGPWAGGDEAVEGMVTAFRDHPAVLGWYLNDERPPWMHAELAARYDQVRALDPAHPTWSVLYQVDAMGEYVDTCDLLGSDPYPLPDRPLTMVTEWTQKTVRAAPERPVLMVPQLHDKSLYYGGDPRPPTAQEARLMAYVALIEGADGLIFYSLFDLRRDVARGWEARWQEALELGEEIQGLTSALLEDAPPSEEVKVEAQAEPGEVRWRMCSRGETVYVLLANPTDQRASVVLTPGERVPQLLPPDRGSLVPPAPGGQCVVHLPPKDALTVVLSPP